MAGEKKCPAALFKVKILQDTSDVWGQFIYPSMFTTVNSVVSAVAADSVLYIHIKSQSQEWTDPQYETD